MSSVEYLREFVNERLTAAAEEIFGVFIKTVVEYEEEIDRQRRLLDIVSKPDIQLHRIELPQQHVCQEEVQERNSSLDQEDPEPPQIKEEQEELCIGQEGEQLELKQETEAYMWTPTYEGSDHSEPEPDPDPDHQLLYHCSYVPESQDRERGEHEDSGSTRNVETNPEKGHHESSCHSNNTNNPTMSDIYRYPYTGKTTFKCETCGKIFKFKSKLQTHMRIHTGERPYLCNYCGKRFIQIAVLTAHKRTHTGEKPFTCKTCGRAFSRNGHLMDHIRTHTGERPYNCETCGRAFRRNRDLIVHIRTHTGEKPYICKICGKAFSQNSTLNCHMKTHLVI